ncbi:hypothetical protein HYS47_02205 [Candidatus Woesearchaeota archaeon]|nr:hypothetical protein [Candidatus Woesearchaeota archaeon]
MTSSPSRTAQVKQVNKTRLTTPHRAGKMYTGTKGVLKTPGLDLPFQTDLDLHLGDFVTYRVVRGQAEVLGKVQRKQRVGTARTE